MFKPELFTGNCPQFLHESGADTTAAEARMGLEVVDRPPVCDEPEGITPEDDPSGKVLPEPGDEETAA